MNILHKRENGSSLRTMFSEPFLAEYRQQQRWWQPPQPAAPHGLTCHGADACVPLVVCGLQLGNACIGALNPFKYNCANKQRIWFRDYSFILPLLRRFRTFWIWFLQFFLQVKCYLCSLSLFHGNIFDSGSMWDVRACLFHVLKIIQRAVWSEVPLHFAGGSLLPDILFTLFVKLSNKLHFFSCCPVSQTVTDYQSLNSLALQFSKAPTTSMQDFIRRQNVSLRG